MKHCTGLLIIFLFLSDTVYSQPFDNLPLNNKQPVLNGKAFFVFPKNAINSARPVDIMSADPNTNRETRLVLDIDSMRLVFFAQELFVTSDENLLSVISARNGDGYNTRILTQADSILSVLSTPVHHDSTKNNILVNSLLVKTPDNTVFRINAYINPAAYRYITQCRILSENVFATVSKGMRRIQYKTRTETIAIYDSRKKFHISLPEGYIVTRDQKYDFEVLQFQKIRNISDDNWSGLSIYIGRYPSFFYTDYHFDLNNAEKPSGHFLKNKVTWLYFKDADNKRYLKEQQIPCNAIAKGIIVHVAMSGSQLSAIDELNGIVESIKLTN